MTRSYWSDPHPREVAPPIVILLSTLGFAAVLGYELGKAGVAVVEWMTGRKL